MTSLTLSFDEIGSADLPRVGGKGANLGVLTAAGVRVPVGFCVTTEAFDRFLAEDAGFAGLMTRLEEVERGDVDAAREIGAALREHVTTQPVPDDLSLPILEAWRAAGGEAHTWAVRSSATAEDLPDASSAGQQDTYLNVAGEQALLDNTRACWASLYTDRAILYRLENDIPHRDVSLSVVVQRMVLPRTSGILFTADPVSGHRGVVAIDAGFGLGEALVSGLVSADLYRLDKATGALIESKVGDKSIAIVPVDGGGTRTEELSAERRAERVLSDGDLAQLLDVARRIEATQGCPQDIEWCFDDDGLHVVQSRPITSLYPLADPAPQPGHVYFCFNHFQVMTDAMPPMVCSIWRTLLPLGRAPADLRVASISPWSEVAAGRIFLNLAPALRFPPVRHLFLKALHHIDRLAGAAVAELVARPSFRDGPRVNPRSVVRVMAPLGAQLQSWLWFRNPVGVLERRNAWLAEILEAGRRQMSTGSTSLERLRSTREFLGAFFADLVELPPIVLGGVFAGAVVRRLVPDSDDLVDALGRGLAGNVTTEMDLDVGDLADVARRAEGVADLLRAGGDWRTAPGGLEFGEALDGFLEQHGMRAPSEIDLSRPRWREDPSSVLQAVAGNLVHADPGSHREHRAALDGKAKEAAAELERRAGRGLLGFIRKRLVRRLIRTHRALSAMREHPKLGLVSALDHVRILLLEIGDELVAAERIDVSDDVWFFEFDELLAALEDPATELRSRVAVRRAEHVRNQALYPPRVMTGEGEIPQVRHAAGDAPDGALVGSPASAGVVEGIARVVMDPRAEMLDKGEILVAPFTDPGWTPLFLNAAGLVMEVGGLMTHGSVVAREYGIPAVVCVPGATKQIRTGQRIRVHGDGGWVEVLDAEETA